MERKSNLRNIITEMASPLLIISTRVGRGMYYLGNAVKEIYPDATKIKHIAIEEFLPPRAVTEDVERYKFISNRIRPLLYFIYKSPLVYYRKYAREKYFVRSRLATLKEEIESFGAKTVICISHRPAFWVSVLKRNDSMNFKLWGMLGEYGKTFGWKYVFWERIDGFLSPMPKDTLNYDFQENMRFVEIDLPARKEFYEAGQFRGDINSVVLVCGYWGQGSFDNIVKPLSKEMPQLKIDIVCGENSRAYKYMKKAYNGNGNIMVYGVVESLAPLLMKCGSIITKPGISTLLEACAAERKIFLLKGMPVAEDNNASYAFKHYDAQWFSIPSFKAWYTSSIAQ